MAQVHNRVNAGIMDGITCGGMFEDAEPEKNKYEIAFEDGGMEPYAHIVTEGKLKDLDNFDYERYIKSFIKFLRSQHLSIDPLPKIELKNDEQDGLFIKTGYYDPNEKKVVAYINDRHPKDVMRTIAHEFVHHMQNIQDPNKDWGSNGDLEQDRKLRGIEGEAFLLGNILFREWTEYAKKYEKNLNESKKTVKNDKGKIVPKKCDKCGGDVVLQIHGEPVYVCKECGKYFGTMPFPGNLDEINISKALKRLKKRRDPGNIEDWGVLKESPDRTCYMSLFYNDDEAIPFMVLNGDEKFYVGNGGQTHIEIMSDQLGYDKEELYQNIDDDTFGEYVDLEKTGRYWPEEDVISFWKTPNTTAKLIDVLNKLSSYVDIDFKNLLIDWWDNTYDRLIPFRWFTNGTVDFLNSLGFTDAYPKNIDEYINTGKYTDFKVKIKGGRIDTYDLAGDPVQSEYQYSFSELDESLTNETPDGILNNGFKLYYWDSDAIPFLFSKLDNEFHVGEPGETHISIFRKLGASDRDIYKFGDDRGNIADLERTGRYWPEKNIISFWQWPSSTAKLMSVINILSSDVDVDTTNLLIDWWDSRYKRIMPYTWFKNGTVEFLDERGFEDVYPKDSKEYENTGKYTEFSVRLKNGWVETYDLYGNEIVPEWQRSFSELDESKQDADRSSWFLTLYGKNTYGTTEDFDSAGFILYTGELLDFGNYKDIFRQAHGALDLDGKNKQDFMNAGNIRVNCESPGIEFSKEPTEEQYDRIREMVEHFSDRDKFYVDCINSDGSNEWSQEYESGDADGVCDDIMEYFNEGIEPDVDDDSLVRRFHVSDSDPEAEQYPGFLEEKIDISRALKQLKRRRDPANIENWDALNEITDEVVEPDDVDLSSFNIKKHLNPKFWDDGHLDTRIRLKLLDIADDFFNSLDVDWVEPEDIIITGSLANYNWNKKYSDIDLHILVDYEDVDERVDFVREYFTMKKNEWNQKHKNLKIFGFPVEVYVQDSNEPHASSGVYSIDRDEWITEPDMKKIRSGKVDKKHVRETISTYMNKIDNLIDIYKHHKDDKYEMKQVSDDAAEMLSDIKQMRKDDLNKYGKEMCDGNIIFKALRRSDYIGKLIKLKNLTYDKINSL